MAAAQHMEMKMKYSLPAMHPGVHDEAIPVAGYPLLLCDLVADKYQMPEQADIRIVKFSNRGHMLPRDDERMCRRLRIDIVECDHHIILIDEGCRNGPRDDFTKEALTHEVVPFLKPDLPKRVANS